MLLPYSKLYLPTKVQRKNDISFVYCMKSCNFAPEMSLIDIILLAVALAMDCLTVSIVSGVLVSTVNLRMAFFFGLFQAMMPLIGWLAPGFHWRPDGVGEPASRGGTAFQSPSTAHPVAASRCHQHRCPGRRHLLCLYWLYICGATYTATYHHRSGVVPFQSHRLSGGGPLRQKRLPAFKT